MNNDQRSAMYNGWARTKKWIKIEVKELEDNSGWMAVPITSNVGDPGFVVYRDTKAQVIYAISGKLQAKGYEISNLAEVQGII